MPVFGEDLAAEVGRLYGAPVQMMQLRHGIFDEASISVIALDTMREIGRLAGRSLDVRRFRPNVVVRLLMVVPTATSCRCQCGCRMLADPGSNLPSRFRANDTSGISFATRSPVRIRGCFVHNRSAKKLTWRQPR